MYLRDEMPSGGYACKAATNHGKAFGACGALSFQCGWQKVSKQAAFWLTSCMASCGSPAGGPP